MALEYEARSKHIPDVPGNDASSSSLPELTPEESAEIDRLIENSANGKNYTQAFEEVTGRTPGEYMGRPAEPAEEPGGQLTFMPRLVHVRRSRSAHALESQDRRPDLKPPVPRVEELNLKPASADTPPPRSEESERDRAIRLSNEAWLEMYALGDIEEHELPPYLREPKQ